MVTLGYIVNLMIVWDSLSPVTKKEGKKENVSLIIV